MSMIGNTPGVSSQRTVLEEVISGSAKSNFVPQGGYVIGYVDVLVNGHELDSSDFTAADGININLAVAAAVGDTVKVKAWLPRGLSDGYLKSEADARFLNLAGGQLTGNLGLGIAPKAWGLGKAIDINNGALYGYSSGGVTGITLAYNSYFDGVAWKAKQAGASSMIQLGAGTMAFYNAPSVAADAATTLALGFSVDPNGVLSAPNQVRVCLVGGGGSKAAGTYNYWGDTSARVLANTGGGWNYGTQVFTAPVTGNYLVTAHIRMSSEGSSTYNYIQFDNTNNTVNCTPLELWAPGVQSGGTYRPRQLTAMIRLNKNDTLTPRLYIGDTATLDGGNAAQANDYLNITLIN